MIEANSIFGNKVSLPEEKFTVRVSAYAIIILDNKLLLVNTKSNNKWYFPGGEIEIGETIEEAIKREVFEETSVKVEVEKFLTLKENFFYYDPADKAWQTYSFYYICKPLSFDLNEDNQVEFDEANKPTWVEINQLKNTDFSFPADEVFSLINK